MNIGTRPSRINSGNSDLMRIAKRVRRIEAALLSPRLPAKKRAELEIALKTERDKIEAHKEALRVAGVSWP